MASDSSMHLLIREVQALTKAVQALKPVPAPAPLPGFKRANARALEPAATALQVLPAKPHPYAGDME